MHVLTGQDDSRHCTCQRCQRSPVAMLTCGDGILTVFPFGCEAFAISLRIDSPVAKRSCHGTLLHISPYGSHVCNRYYHQDLHYSTVQRGSRPAFDPCRTPSYSLAKHASGCV